MTVVVRTVGGGMERDKVKKKKKMAGKQGLATHLDTGNSSTAPFAKSGSCEVG